MHTTGSLQLRTRRTYMPAPATPSTEKIEGKTIVDPGIERGIENLTPEKTTQIIKSVLDSEAGARFKTYIDICVHCGLCSEACHYFLSHGGNPLFSPAGKVKQTIWEIMKNKARVTPDFLRQAAEIAYTECNLCRRCAMY